MPHVIVKLWPGKSDEQKQRLAQAITQAVIDTLNYREDAVSVGFQEVAPADWNDQVYGPDILDRWPTLLKQPGHGPGAAERPA